MEDHIELGILERCFDYEWSNVYCVSERVELNSDESIETTNRNYVFIFEYYHYRMVWTRVESLGDKIPYEDKTSWGEREPIDVPEYDHLRDGRERIDTQVKRRYLDELKKRVKRRAKKDAASKRPKCPKCRKHKMVLHSAEWGDHWKCLKAPKCRAKKLVALTELSHS
jgi:hypothetical protein